MKTFALALSMLLVTGFSMASDSEKEVTIEDTHWQLTQYADDTGEMVSVLPDTTVDVEFSNGELGGNAGCNRYFGGYALEGEQIRFTSQMGSTQMACAPSTAKQEQRYLTLLPQATSWKLEEGQLILIDEDGTTVLEFVAVERSALEDTEWQAVGINNGKGGVASTHSTSLSTAIFADGTISGTGGCNRYNTAFETEGNRISIGPAAATRKFCTEPEGIMDQEQEFFAALAKVHTFEVTQGRLELRDEKGSLQVSFSSKSP